MIGKIVGKIIGKTGATGPPIASEVRPSGAQWRPKWRQMIKSRALPLSWFHAKQLCDTAAVSRSRRPIQDPLKMTID
ncbi:MAG: hypothetical protein WA740_10895 [Candidatus Binataceae bacterium]